jgi:hypothetical protein
MKVQPDNYQGWVTTFYIDCHINTNWFILLFIEDNVTIIREDKSYLLEDVLLDNVTMPENIEPQHTV